MTDRETFTDEQLAAMKRPPLAKRVRRSTALSHEVFAERFGIPLRTLQEWEQGRREPELVAHALAAEWPETRPGVGHRHCGVKERWEPGTGNRWNKTHRTKGKFRLRVSCKELVIILGKQS